MKSSKKLTLEINRLNHKLDQISNQSRFFIYSTNPWKFAYYNFISGIFHSLGSLFGTVVVAGALVYFLSQINLVQPVSNFIDQVFSQVRWEKYLPPTPAPRN